MKTAKEETEKTTTEKPAKATKGRAAFVHKLKADGVQKAEALKRTQERFACSASLFDRIWKRGAQGAESAEEKPTSAAADSGQKKAPKASAPKRAPAA